MVAMPVIIVYLSSSFYLQNHTGRLDGGHCMLFMLYLYASEFSFIAMLVSILDVAYCKNVTTGRFHCFDDEQVKDVATNSIRVCTYVCTAVFSVTWLCHTYVIFACCNTLSNATTKNTCLRVGQNCVCSYVVIETISSNWKEHVRT